MSNVQNRAKEIIAKLEAAYPPDILLKHLKIAGEALSLLREIVAEPDYEALEREHLGDPDKRTGIYAPRSDAAPNDDARDAARYRFIRDDNDCAQSDRYWEAISAGGDRLDTVIDNWVKSRQEDA